MRTRDTFEIVRHILKTPKGNLGRLCAHGHFAIDAAERPSRLDAMLGTRLTRQILRGPERTCSFTARCHGPSLAKSPTDHIDCRIARAFDTQDEPVHPQFNVTDYPCAGSMVKRRKDPQTT